MAKKVRTTGYKEKAYIAKQNAKAAKAAARAATASKYLDYKIKKRAINKQTKAARTSEYYKTKRTTARSAAAASAVTASEESRQKTAREEAKLKYNLSSVTLDQYAKLINGNQGEANIVNPSDDSGNPSTSWSPNDTL